MAKALFYEAGRTLVDVTELTDAGDQKRFDSAVRRWSDYPGFSPEILPNAVLSGGVGKPAVSETADAVDVSAVNCYLNGVKKTGTDKIAAATDVAFTRGATAYMIVSVVVTAAGAIDAIEGTDSASSFSATRGEAGGPPYVPVDAVELFHIRLTSATSGVVTADEISAVPGTSREDLQSFSIHYSRVENRIKGYAGVEFSNPLPAIHTGDLPAKVFASFYTPNLARLEAARDVEFAATTGSASAEVFYDVVRNYESKSLSAGSFEFDAGDGISHPYLGLIENRSWHVLYPDDLNPEIFTQVLATPFISGSFPAEGANLRTVNLISRTAADLVIA